MKISVLKNKRELHIPSDATVAELTEILCKWAPIIANDEDRKAFTLVSAGKSAKSNKSIDDSIDDMFGKDTKSNPFSGFDDIFGAFGDIFGKK